MNSSSTTSTEAAAPQPLFTTSSSQFPSLAAYRSWLQSQGGQSGVMNTSAIIEADLNKDGKNELIVQFSSYPSAALGALSNLPTPNRLVIFSLGSDGSYADVTSSYLTSNLNGAVSLAGQIANSAIADLNRDGSPDIAFALNRNDGRSLASSLSVSNAVLLSQPGGSYKVLAIEPSQAQEAAMSESVAILNQGSAALPQLVFATTSPLADAAVGLQRYVLETVDGNPSFKLLASDVSDQPVTLIPLPGEQLSSASPTTRMFALDNARGLIQYRVNPDGSIIETGSAFPIEVSERVFRTDAGKLGEFSPEPSIARTYSVDDALYIVRGIEAASYVQAVQGAETAIAVSVRLQRVTATEDENGDMVLSSLGAELSLLRFMAPGVYEPGLAEVGMFKGKSESTVKVTQIQARDLDGDGHQDLVVSYAGANPALSLYMNSGSGNFYSVDQAAVPDIADLIRGTRGNVYGGLINLGSDQDVDLLFVNASADYNSGNFYLFHGTGAIGGGPNFNKAAVIGFNERYYLENNEEAMTALDTGLVARGLDYYLSQGQPEEAKIFAPGTKLFGTSGNDLIRAREGAESIKAGDGNDRIFPGEGNDTVDAGAGLDVAIYSGQRAQYQVTKTMFQGQNVWQLSDPVAGETDLLIGVEKLQFAQAFDGDPLSEVTLDVDGNPAIAFRLYRAAFAREPDLAGLGYWVDVLIQNQNNPSIAPDQNILLLDIASAFVGSAEFKALYGDDVSSGDYVLNLYKNTLGRDPLELNPATGTAYDQAGYEYWKSVLDAGATTRQHMFVFFSESKENRDAVADLIGQGIEYIPWGG
jgi:hypothetical protein